MRAAQERLEELQKQIKKQEISPLRKILFIILFCFSVVLIGAYVAYLMDSRYFLLDFEFKDGKYLSLISGCILFVINIFLCMRITTEINLNHCIIFSSAYVPVYLLSDFLLKGTLVFSILIPFLYVFTCNTVNLKQYNKNHHIKFIISFLLYSIASVIYQYVSCIIKFNIHPDLINYPNISVISRIFYCIDYYIFLCVIIALKGGEYNGQRMEHVFRTEAIGDIIHDNEDLEAIAKFNSLSKGRKLKAGALLMAFQIFQMFFILFVCKIGNVFIECCIMMLSFLLAGTVIKNRWHSKNVAVCTLVMALTFYIACRAIIPVKISMFFPVLIGILIAYSLYLVAMHTQEYESLKNQNQMHTKLTDREKLVQELYEVKGWKIEDIALEINRTRRTVDRILKDIRKKE